MIAFASLLLGLVVGPHPVDLLVADSVVAVEIRLDGRPVGMLDGEPWSLDCDFGPQLVPHELVAVAYDDHLEEIYRARHWINLPRRPAEAAIVLEGGDDGKGVAARLRWESVTGVEPEAVAAWLDGEPLAVDDPRRIPLPVHDPEKLHFLRAELDFAGNVSSVLDLVFGGTYADRESVALTAVPVFAEGGEEPALADFDGRLSSRGRRLTVVAVEEGPAEVLVVRDERTRPALNRLGRTSTRVLRQRARGDQGALGAARRRLRFRMTLGGEHQIRFLWPFPQRQGDELELLSPSPPHTREDGGLYWLLTEVTPAVLPGEDQRLADAVAVAGLLAAGRNRRRAVVLVLAAGTPEVSRFTPRSVRRYLEELRVPLVVWSPDGAAGGGGPWDEVTDVSSLRKLERAVADLDRLLGRQRIVWVDGVHLPGSIVLDRPAPADRFHLVR